MKQVLEGKNFANFLQIFGRNKNLPKQSFGTQYSKICKTWYLQKFNTFESICKQICAG